MDLSNLKPGAPRRTSRKRVGRGPSSGTGKTSGRGHKGQKSRSGYARRGAFEGGQMPLNRRLPKRGFRHQKRHPFAEVNVSTLEKRFNDGDEVTYEALIARKLIEPAGGGFKVLGQGELTKKLAVKAQACSAGARERITSAGGSVDIVALAGSAPAAAAETAATQAPAEEPPAGETASE
jgi:large subunit ribosomal protein L15